MQTAATAGAWDQNVATRDMMDARLKREAVAAQQIRCLSVICPPFFSGHGGNAANSCFSAAGKNENALFICAPSIMNPASAEGGGGGRPRREVCVCQ